MLSPGLRIRLKCFNRQVPKKNVGQEKKRRYEVSKELILQLIPFTSHRYPLRVLTEYQLNNLPRRSGPSSLEVDDSRRLVRLSVALPISAMLHC